MIFLRVILFKFLMLTCFDMSFTLYPTATLLLHAAFTFAIVCAMYWFSFLFLTVCLYKYVFNSVPFPQLAGKFFLPFRALNYVVKIYRVLPLLVCLYKHENKRFTWVIRPLCSMVLFGLKIVRILSSLSTEYSICLFLLLGHFMCPVKAMYTDRPFDFEYDVLNSYTCWSTVFTGIYVYMKGWLISGLPAAPPPPPQVPAPPDVYFGFGCKAFSAQRTASASSQFSDSIHSIS